jgi:hypothetical protein
MPQASDEQRTEWGIDDAPVIAFLENRGYKLTRQWTWVLPTPDHHPTEKEISAICFLIDEWDFGGLDRNDSI